MAHMYQARKNELAPEIKAVCKRYGIKGTLSVRNHSTLVLTIQSGKIDFLSSGKRMGSIGQDTDKLDYSINPYWYTSHFDGEAKDFLTEVFAAMNKGNHDNSDVQVDYFDVGWYNDVSIGRYNKPYKLEA